MRTKIAALISLIIISLASFSQTPHESKVKEKSPYLNYLDLGLLVGSSEDQNSSSPSVQFVSAYQLKNRISLGVGTGIEFFEVVKLPIYADLRYTLFPTNGSPYVMLQMGTTMDIHNSYEGKSNLGLIINPGIGIKRQGKKNMAFLFSIGYRYQQQVREYYSNNYWYADIAQDYTKRKSIYNRINVRMGLSF